MVDSITSMGAAATPSKSAAAGQNASSALSSDFETFLKMLTVQVQNQDPLNPLDATDYASQLATFSGVEQQVQTNSLLKELSATLSGNALQGLSDWIGKEGLVTAPAWFNGNPVIVRPEYAPGASSGILSVMNDSGQIIQRVPFSADQSSFVWQGVDENGNKLPNGAYTFEVESYDSKGLIDTSLAQVYSQIEEVRVDNGAVVVRMADGTELSPDDITGLRVPLG